MKTCIRIIKDAKPQMIFLILGLFASAIATVASFYMPWAIRELTSLATQGVANFAQSAFHIGLILLITTVIQAAGSGVSGYLNHHGALLYVKQLRMKLYSKLQQMSLRYFNDSSTGDLTGRVVGDTMKAEELLAHVIPDVITNFITFIGVSIILFSLNIKLALASLIIIPILGVVNYWRVKKVRGLWTDIAGFNGRISGILQDNFSGIREILIFNRQNQEEKRLNSLFQTYTKQYLKASAITEFSFPIIAFLSALGIIIVITFGSSLTESGEISIADIVAFVMYLNMLYAPIKALAVISANAVSAIASCQRVFDVMDLTSDVQEKPDAANLPRSEGKIELKDVSFAYSNEVPVLENINIAIKPGHTIALVGTTGVGKTTIASLVNRFYDPQKGGVYIDGTDIRDVTLNSLRDNISMVLQDTFLFNGSVYENIVYGWEDATKDQVLEAAKAANAHQFIQELKDGYDTVVGERGVRLSGGQKQRISIARAILRNAPILILDEATSSLDSKTEKEIQAALDKISMGRTTIVIAHRLSTIRHSDCIVVLDGTGIAEMGTHEELIRNGNIYASLLAAQEA